MFHAWKGGPCRFTSQRTNCSLPNLCQFLRRACQTFREKIGKKKQPPLQKGKILKGDFARTTCSNIDCCNCIPSIPTKSASTDSWHDPPPKKRKEHAACIRSIQARVWTLFQPWQCALPTRPTRGVRFRAASDMKTTIRPASGSIFRPQPRPAELKELAQRTSVGPPSCCNGRARAVKDLPSSKQEGL